MQGTLCRYMVQMSQGHSRQVARAQHNLLQYGNPYCKDAELAKGWCASSRWHKDVPAAGVIITIICVCAKLEFETM